MKLGDEEQTYGIIKGLQEVDFICHTVHLNLQLHFVHVGSIDILGENSAQSL